jgi:hypothetical protein
MIDIKSQDRLVTSARPSLMLVSSPALVAGGCVATARGRRVRKAALTRNVAASIRIAHPGPTVATSAPAVLSARIEVMLRDIDRSELASCTCSLPASEATRPTEAGLKRAVPMPAI